MPMDKSDMPKPIWRPVPMPGASPIRFMLESAVTDETLERMARFACEWEGVDPETSLCADGFNFRWIEARDTLIVPLLEMLDGAD